jgi:hypothetical protein
MSGTEALSFKLQTKTAGKLAIGVLSVDPTAEHLGHLPPQWH